MNTGNGSLKNRPSIVTKASPNISLIVDDAEEERDCEERSKRYMCKGLFLVLQSDSRLINMH